MTALVVPVRGILDGLFFRYGLFIVLERHSNRLGLCADYCIIRFFGGKWKTKRPGETVAKEAVLTDDRSFSPSSQDALYFPRGLIRNSFPKRPGAQPYGAVLAHALASYRDVFGKECDPNEAAALALFHDASEISPGICRLLLNITQRDKTAYRQWRKYLLKSY
jgi:hypothetical protein